MDLTKRFGLELIERQALKVLFDHLNDKIVEMQPTWTIEDDNYWASLNRGYQNWFVEPIENENFYPGTIPSLVGASIDKYPNVCTVAYIGQPTNSSDDTGDLYGIRLAIEVMVRSEEETEIEVNSRINRTLDAIELVFMDSLANRTLNNTVLGLNAPAVTKGNVFQGRELGSHGNPWFWQGGSVEYIVDKFVNLDS